MDILTQHNFSTYELLLDFATLSSGIPYVPHELRICSEASKGRSSYSTGFSRIPCGLAETAGFLDFS
jgi:hypothetical protein